MDATEVDRLLIEIDENLCRLELSPAECAHHEAKRKELLELKCALQESPNRPVSASVVDSGASELGGSNCSTRLAGGPEPGLPAGLVGDVDARGQLKSPQQRPGYARSAAPLTGKSKVAVNRNVRRGQALGDSWREVVGTRLDRGIELDALTKLSPEIRADLIKRAKDGEKVSAKKVLASQSQTPSARNKTLALRAISALESCTREMDARDFAAALQDSTIPESIVALAQVLAYGRGNAPAAN